MSDSEKIDQDEIEELLRQVQASSGGGGGSGSSPQAGGDGPRASAPPMAGGSTPPGPSGLDRAGGATGTQVGDDIQFLLNQAEQAIQSVDRPRRGPTPPGLAPFALDDLGASPLSAEKATLELLRDVELDLKIELGRTHMCLEDVLKLRRGAVVPLDKLAGDPVDIFVNGRLIARGEVLVLNDNFCVRVAELVAGEETE
ncbi:MAG: flagellar motor switch protein FliN [Planctomycetes bacterium]|nr:flagellar motor switch protein FliN [Planctomycetota bacterium]